MTLFYGGAVFGMEALGGYVLNTVIVMTCLCPLYMAGAVGGGDIKLLCVFGGMLGVGTALKTALTALFIAALYGAALILIRREKRMHKIHFSYAIFAALVIGILNTQIVF